MGAFSFADSASAGLTPPLSDRPDRTAAGAHRRRCAWPAGITLQVWRMPILLVLYTGMFLDGDGTADAGTLIHRPGGRNRPDMHLASGGIGVLPLGMMSRVSLGHSGRPIDRSAASRPPLSCSTSRAAAARVFGHCCRSQTTPSGSISQEGSGSSASCFLPVYLPILSRPRIDVNQDSPQFIGPRRLPRRTAPLPSAIGVER